MTNISRSNYDPEVEESEYDRLERRWTEQLSELRVTQAGTQIMMGFLLTLSFQPSFETISLFERNLYLSLVITATLATVLAIAPVSFHRILFGHPGAKARVVSITQVLLRLTPGIPRRYRLLGNMYSACLQQRITCHLLRGAKQQ